MKNNKDSLDFKVINRIPLSNSVSSKIASKNKTKKKNKFKFKKRKISLYTPWDIPVFIQKVDPNLNQKIELKRFDKLLDVSKENNLKVENKPFLNTQFRKLNLIGEKDDVEKVSSKNLDVDEDIKKISKSKENLSKDDFKIVPEDKIKSKEEVTNIKENKNLKEDIINNLKKTYSTRKDYSFLIPKNILFFNFNTFKDNLKNFKINNLKYLDKENVTKIKLSDVLEKNKTIHDIFPSFSFVDLSSKNNEDVDINFLINDKNIFKNNLNYISYLESILNNINKPFVEKQLSKKEEFIEHFKEKENSIDGLLSQLNDKTKKLTEDVFIESFSFLDSKPKVDKVKYKSYDVKNLYSKIDDLIKKKENSFLRKQDVENDLLEEVDIPEIEIIEDDVKDINHSIENKFVTNDLEDIKDAKTLNEEYDLKNNSQKVPNFVVDKDKNIKLNEQVKKNVSDNIKNKKRFNDFKDEKKEEFSILEFNDKINRDEEKRKQIFSHLNFNNIDDEKIKAKFELINKNKSKKKYKSKNKKIEKEESKKEDSENKKIEKEDFENKKIEKEESKKEDLAPTLKEKKPFPSFKKEPLENQPLKVEVINNTSLDKNKQDVSNLKESLKKELKDELNKELKDEINKDLNISKTSVNEGNLNNRNIIPTKKKDTSKNDLYDSKVKDSLELKDSETLKSKDVLDEKNLDEKENIEMEVKETVPKIEEVKPSVNIEKPYIIKQDPKIKIELLKQDYSELKDKKVDYVLPKDINQKIMISHDYNYGKSDLDKANYTSLIYDEPIYENNKDITKIFEKYSIDEFTYVNIFYDEVDGLIYNIVQPEISDDDREEFDKIKRTFFSSIDRDYYSFGGDKYKLEKYMGKIYNITLDKLSYNLDPFQKKLYFKLVKRDFFGLGILTNLLQDKKILEVNCSGEKSNLSVYHIDYGILKTNISFPNMNELNKFVINLTKNIGIFVTENHPIINGYLPNGYKVEGLYSTGDTSSRGSSFVIKKYLEEPLSPISLIKTGIGSIDVFSYIWSAIEEDYNIVLVGIDDSFSIFNSLLLFYPNKKIITVQSYDRLKIPQKEWINRVFKNNPDISKNIIINQSISQKPDYLVVDEFGRDIFDISWYDINFLSIKPNIYKDFLEEVKSVDQRTVFIEIKNVKKGNKENIQIMSIKEIFKNQESKIAEIDVSKNIYSINLLSSNIDVVNFQKRKKVIKWMFSSRVYNYIDFNNIVSEFYLKKEKVFERLNIK